MARYDVYRNPRQALKRPVANLGANAFEIQNALDFLFAGI